MTLSSGVVINGVRYGAESYSITIDGQPTNCVSELSYEDTMEGKFIYGTSEVPIGRTRGSYTCTATMGIWLAEADELHAILASKGEVGAIAEAVFDITVRVSELNAPQIFDILRGCRLKNLKSAMPGTGGNDSSVVTYDLMPYFIRHNGRTLFRNNKVPVR